MRWVILFALTLIGCKTWPSSPIEGWQEAFIIQECHRAGDYYHKDPKCIITDEAYIVEWEGEQVPAAGWNSGGTIYFYRHWVNEQEDPALLTELACHEAAHFKIKGHPPALYQEIGRCMEALRAGG